MGKNDKKTMPEKPENLFTEEMFLNSLLTVPENAEGSLKEQEGLQRDIKYKMKVLQAILYLEVPDLILSGKECDEEKGKKLIEDKVENDELLFGYTFHVSSNPEFKRNWSYMRKQLDKYAAFLFGAKRFFEFVFRDVKALIGILQGIQDVHVVFDGLVDAAYSDEVPCVRTKMLWEHFHNLTHAWRGYYKVSVMVKETILVVCDCSYKNGTDKLCEKVKEARDNFGL